MTSGEPLRNPRSDAVRKVSGLGRRAVRRRTGQFLVEGPQAVRELLTHRPDRTETLYTTAAAAERYTDLVALATRAGIRVQPVTDEVLAAMADADSPQGLLAVAHSVTVEVAEALAAVSPDDVVVVLAHVRDPGNAGTVIRGASAFGAAAVLVSDSSVDVHHPKVVRSTVGALFHLPVATGAGALEILRACSRAGVRTLAADGAGTTMLPDADLTGPHAWVMGNEAWGLPEEIREACDDVVAIPIVRAESLNLAMAATVCLHASASRA